MKTIIIGGVAGGASAAARLRRLNEQAEILLIERGEYISFANCGLPYYIGGTIQNQKNLTLQTPESFRARFNIDVRTNSEAVALSPADKTVTIRCADGRTYTETYDKLILSPGAEPVRPPVEGIDAAGVFTLRNIPDTLRIKQYVTEKQPKTAAVIGGGYIGVEMAENLTEAGLKVHIVELAEHLIAPLDFDMAADVQSYIKSKGVCLHTSNGVAALHETENGLLLQLQKGQITADMVILAVGVRPETALAKSAGLTCNARGSIVVNEQMQTSDPDIYAVGDAAEVTHYLTGSPAFLPLAGPANKQGRIAADNICGLASRYTGTQGSSILKLFDLTIAATGLNEAAAQAAGYDYDKTYTYSGSHAAYYPGAQNMSIKALWDKNTYRLLGAQIVGGSGVDKRIDVLAAAIRFGAKITDLTELELCYAPPYGSAKDPVNMLGYVAENIITGKVKQFFWQEVDTLPRDGSVTLLDVRTDAEVSRGKIDGFQHIPLDSLRQSLDRLPKDKPVYVHCHSGLRSYIACRILTGHGYNCYNLAGGWRLYAAASQEKAVPDYDCTQCR